MTQLSAVLEHWHGEQTGENVARTWAWEPPGAAEIIYIRGAGLVEAQALVQGEVPGDGESPDQQYCEKGADEDGVCNTLYFRRNGVGALEAEDVDADEDRHGVTRSVVHWEPDNQE